MGRALRQPPVLIIRRPVDDREGDEVKLPDKNVDEEPPRKGTIKVLNDMQRIYLQENLASENGLNLSSFYRRMAAISQSDGPIPRIGEKHKIVINEIHPYKLLKFPGLEEVNLNYMIDVKSWKKLAHYLKNEVDLPSLLFFIPQTHTLYDRYTDEEVQSLLVQQQRGLMAERAIEFHNLWAGAVHIHLTVNDLTLLNIDHDSHCLLLCRIKKPIVEAILNGLLGSKKKVKEVHLDNLELNDLNAIPTKDMECLILHNVKGLVNKMGYVRKCLKLVYFGCLELFGESVDFLKDFRLRATKIQSAIKMIAIGRAKIVCPAVPQNPINSSPITRLYFNDCYFDANFIKAIPLIFPNLQCVRFYGTMGVRMLYQFLSITSLYKLAIWEVDFAMDEQMKPQMNDCSEESEENFRMEGESIIEEVKYLLSQTSKTANASAILCQPVVGPVYMTRCPQLIELRRTNSSSSGAGLKRRHPSSSSSTETTTAAAIKSNVVEDLALQWTTQILEPNFRNRQDFIRKSNTLFGLDTAYHELTGGTTPLGDANEGLIENLFDI
jgi:hypothetical protein